MARQNDKKTQPVILGPAAHYTGRLVSRQTCAGHAGLVFDRYLPLWQHRTDRHGREHRFEPKEAAPILQGFAKAYSGEQAQHKALLETRLSRQCDICTRYGGTITTVQLLSPLVQGLGLAHPTGNGFTFDPVLGVPWMPATALKGLTRRGAALEGATPILIRRLLGPDPEPNEQDTGALIFLDAWPVTWPKLQVQVITPHYRSYYAALEKRESESFWGEPHGLDDPVPIFFLSVAEHSLYQLCILPRDRAGSNDDIETALSWLHTALEVLGAGGKTAIGFGAFMGRNA